MEGSPSRVSVDAGFAWGILADPSPMQSRLFLGTTQHLLERPIG